MLTVSLLLVAILGFGGIFAMQIYNQIIQAEKDVNASFSNINIQLKKRYGLVAKLLESAKGSLANNKTTLESVIKARAIAITVLKKYENEEASIKQVLATSDQLEEKLAELIDLSETCIELKTDKTFNHVFDELMSMETKIVQVCKEFNKSVKEYNDTILQSPNNLVANLINRTQLEHIELEA